MNAPADLTLAGLLALHPWPEAHAKTPRLEWFWTIDVRMPVDELWRLIADTSRMNRALGVSEMRFEDRGGKRWGFSRPGGVRHEWIEEPWSWVAGQWISSVRLYERGFSKVVYACFRMVPLAEEDGGGSRLYLYFGAIPRGFIGRWALRFGFPRLEKDYRRLLGLLAKEIASHAPSLTTLRALPPPLPEAASARLVTLRDGLYARGLSRPCVDALAEWIRTGDEEDLHRIQVRERARSWRVDEDDLLRVCLHATRDGLLELSWDLVCPHCRGVTDEVAALGVLPAHGACEVCGIDFGTDVEEAIEITFHVHPSVRDVPKRSYCSAEPAKKEHMLVQRALQPGEELEVSPALSEGRYRLRLGGQKRYGYLEVSAVDDAESTLVWRASDEPADRRCDRAKPLRLVNDTGEPCTFVVERTQWNDVALRAGRLLSFQDFRDLFSAEYLGADVQLAIGEQTILFTDMIGSTAMYREHGDPAAFIAVKRHFNEVFAIIAAHRGAVVKTIGDAAMGAFNNPLDAVKASKAIHDCFYARRDETMVRLRISLHTGPCIAVKLNTDLDYFGHTVNVAAKLQSLAECWEIALSDASYLAPGVAAWLSEQRAPLQEVSYSSAAIPVPITGKRWTVYQVTEEAD